MYHEGIKTFSDLLIRSPPGDTLHNYFVASFYYKKVGIRYDRVANTAQSSMSSG